MQRYILFSTKIPKDLKYEIMLLDNDSLYRIDTKKNPSGDCSLKGFICLKVAATYSPTGVQYHRREQA